MFALTMPVLVVIVGMGIDYLVALSDKTRIDTAADAASIAAVTTAKNYYANNSSTMEDPALSNAAIAAGVAAGVKVFNSNVGSTVLASMSPPTVTLTYANLSFVGTVTWSAKVTNHFGPLVNVGQSAISGTASATSSLPKFLDFYVVVDTSGSMGIPTNASDQMTLLETNPDNPTMAAMGYSGGCQFACHFSQYQGFNYTQTHNINLKLNSVGAAVQALLTTATKTKIISNQFRIGIYPFIVDAIQAAPLSSDFTTANSVSANLANYLDQGTSNAGMGSGGTHFENLSNDLAPYLQTPGTGMSSTSTKPFIVLITDGIDNNQVYNPATQGWTGSQPQIPNISMCETAKSAGYTVAVILIPYVPIVDPDYSFSNNEDGVVNNLINTNSISPVMQSCASSGYFFNVSTSADIDNAMQTIFTQAVGMTRMTQ